MPFKLICDCGVNLLANDQLASMRVVCPECGIATSLPKVPDPYNLPSNAQMIPVEEEVGSQSSRKLNGAATARRRAQNRGGPNRRVEEEASATNTTLIVILVVIVVAVIGLLINLTVK